MEIDARGEDEEDIPDPPRESRRRFEFQPIAMLGALLGAVVISFVVIEGGIRDKKATFQAHTSATTLATTLRPTLAPTSTTTLTATVTTTMATTSTTMLTDTLTTTLASNVTNTMAPTSTTTLAPTLATTSIRVGSWNVLEVDDEFQPDWGCPLQIALCRGIEAECTMKRQQRIWNFLEARSRQIDVLCLQEAEDNFFQLQMALSNWTIVRRNGQCAVLMSIQSKFQTVSVNDVPVDNLSGCPSVPLVELKDNQNNTVFVGSVHVKASVSNMDVWYVQTADLMQNISSPIVLGGDFNHNLTRSSRMPSGWSLVYVNKTSLFLHGTAQKEHNWMGNFDGFFVSEPKNHDAKGHLEGFMPKVVLGLPQGGQTQTRAQFSTYNNDSVLLYSKSSNGSSLIVPNSNPKTEPMSDHLFVSAILSWE